MQKCRGQKDALAQAPLLVMGVAFKSHLKPNLFCNIESITILEAWFQVTSENFRT